MNGPRHFRVGSRKSHLAMIQSEWVVETLQTLHPGVTFEISQWTNRYEIILRAFGISTTGDKILDVALSKIGEKSLFTKELELALIRKEIDLVVHSLKDLPTQLPDGLTIAAISAREDPRDAVLFSPKFKVKNLKALPPGSNVGTSSLRRIAQLTRRFPHLSFIDVRGNLNTRLKKLDDPEGPYSALILATAGVKRMGWEDRIGQHLEWEDCMHAVGQGALGVECAEDNEDVIKLLEPLNDAFSYFACLAERGFLRTLEGGCSVPVGVTTSIEESKGQHWLTLRGSVWSLDGSKSVCQILKRNLNASEEEQNLIEDNEVIEDNFKLTSMHSRVFPSFSKESVEIATKTGIGLARKLLRVGAKEILEEVRASS